MSRNQAWWLYSEFQDELYMTSTVLQQSVSYNYNSAPETYW